MIGRSDCRFESLFRPFQPDLRAYPVPQEPICRSNVKGKLAHKKIAFVKNSESQASGRQALVVLPSSLVEQSRRRVTAFPHDWSDTETVVSQRRKALDIHGKFVDRLTPGRLRSTRRAQQAQAGALITQCRPALFGQMEHEVGPLARSIVLPNDAGEQPENRTCLVGQIGAR